MQKTLNNFPENKQGVKVISELPIERLLQQVFNLLGVYDGEYLGNLEPVTNALYKFNISNLTFEKDNPIGSVFLCNKIDIGFKSDIDYYVINTNNFLEFIEYINQTKKIDIKESDKIYKSLKYMGIESVIQIYTNALYLKKPLTYIKKRVKEFQPNWDLLSLLSKSIPEKFQVLYNFLQIKDVQLIRSIVSTGFVKYYKFYRNEEDFSNFYFNEFKKIEHKYSAEGLQKIILLMNSYNGSGSDAYQQSYFLWSLRDFLYNLK